MSAATRTEYGIRRAIDADSWPDGDGEVIVSGRWYAAVDLDDMRRERLREAAQAAGVVLLVRTATTRTETSAPEVVEPPATPISALPLGSFVRKPDGSVWALTNDSDGIPWHRVYQGRDGGVPSWCAAEALQAAGAVLVKPEQVAQALSGRLP